MHELKLKLYFVTIVSRSFTIKSLTSSLVSGNGTIITRPRRRVIIRVTFLSSIFVSLFGSHLGVKGYSWKNLRIIFSVRSLMKSAESETQISRFFRILSSNSLKVVSMIWVLRVKDGEYPGIAIYGMVFFRCS